VIGAGVSTSSPKTLKELSAAVVVSKVRHSNDVDLLPIPDSIIDLLKDFYMKKLLFCEEEMPKDFN
jgi:hypothetical protein